MRPIPEDGIHRPSKPSCPICEKPDSIRPYFTDFQDQHDPASSYMVFECNRCTHRFTWPVPTEAHLSRYYDSDYYSYNIDAGLYNQQAKFRLKAFILRHLGNPLIRFIFTPVIRETTILPEGIPGKILDIGCGSGSFLGLMKECGWQTYGIETSKRAVDYCTRNGHNVKMGSLIEQNFPVDFFDVITLNNVLEHLSDIRGTLSECRRILKPNGEIIICVPNNESFEAKLFGKYWLALLIPIHLHHFTMNSLSTLLDSSRLKVWKKKYCIRKGVQNNLHYYLQMNPEIQGFDLLKVRILSFFLSASYGLFFFFNNKMTRFFCQYISAHGLKV